MPVKENLEAELRIPDKKLDANQKQKVEDFKET